MTLIAFATYGNRAELITDTAAYTPWCRSFGYRNKSLALPHLDAVLATQGSHTFAAAARLEFSEMDTSFDDAAALATERLRLAWTALDDHSDAVEGSAFLIGLSEAAGEFVAYQYLAEHDFERERVTGVHMMPTPLNYRPTAFEIKRLAKANSTLDDWDEFAADWSSELAEPTLPTSREEWVDLALEVRRSRGLCPMPSVRVIVAGRLIWTRIAPGRIRTEVIHEFDDHGEELDQLVAGTLHPRAQIAPCACGSGMRALDCHIAAAADEPCPCPRGEGQGAKTFRDCCMITPEEAELAVTMGLV